MPLQILIEVALQQQLSTSLILGLPHIHLVFNLLKGRHPLPVFLVSRQLRSVSPELWLPVLFEGLIQFQGFILNPLHC